MIRDYRSDDLDGVRRLLMENGWGGRASDRDRLRQIIASATRAVVVEDGGAIVAFGRCITDHVSNGYLSMIVVAVAYRRRGIGRAVVAELTGDSPEVTWVLRAGHPDAAPFWKGIGFTRSKVAYERSRRI